MTEQERKILRLELRIKAADRLAASVDVMVSRKVLDARSVIADARLAYGEPFSLDKAEELMMETRPPMETGT